MGAQEHGVFIALGQCVVCACECSDVLMFWYRLFYYLFCVLQSLQSNFFQFLGSLYVHFPQHFSSFTSEMYFNIYKIYTTKKTFLHLLEMVEKDKNIYSR